LRQVVRPRLALSARLAVGAPAAHTKVRTAADRQGGPVGEVAGGKLQRVRMGERLRSCTGLRADPSDRSGTDCCCRPCIVPFRKRREGQGQETRSALSRSARPNMHWESKHATRSSTPNPLRPGAGPAGICSHPRDDQCHDSAAAFGCEQASLVVDLVKSALRQTGNSWRLRRRALSRTTLCEAEVIRAAVARALRWRWSKVSLPSGTAEEVGETRRRDSAWERQACADEGIA